MLGSGINPWPVSFIVWPPLISNQPIKAQAVESDHRMIMASAREEGGPSSRASGQLDVTFAFGGLREVEKVSRGPLSPQLSALHNMSDCP